MYRISETVRSTHSPDGAILLDLERGRVLRLNVTGSYIFRALKHGESESQIAQHLSQAFHLSHERAISDITEFLLLLEQKGLVQIMVSEEL